MKNAVYWNIKALFVPHRLRYRAQQVNCFVRFEFLTVVTMKNAVFRDIETQLIPRRRHIMSPLQSPAD
jgi:hypothetical protein